MEKCLTRAEVAERYQISERHVRDLEILHDIPVLRFGRAVRYDANALAALEEAARQPKHGRARHVSSASPIGGGYATALAALQAAKLRARARQKR